MKETSDPEQSTLRRLVHALHFADVEQLSRVLGRHDHGRRRRRRGRRARLVQVRCRRRVLMEAHVMVMMVRVVRSY